MKTKLVKPDPGIRVFDPYGQGEVPADGAIVPWNSFWQRRVLEGGLSIVEEQPPKASPKTKTKSYEDNDK